MRGFLTGIVIIVGLIGIITLAIQWSFNIFVSPVFGLPQITFVQALALQVLFYTLSKSPAYQPSSKAEK